MKLYIVTLSEPEGHRVCVSQAECAKTRAEFVSAGAKRKDISTYELGVPTTKAELVEFLNGLIGNATVEAGINFAVAKYNLTKD
jgi:hypothetical protein